MNTRATHWTTFPGAARARVVRRSRPREASRFMDNALCALLALYLASLMLEGVLRYALVMSGFPNLLYLRDAIPVVSVLFLFMRTLLLKHRIDLTIAIPAGLLACHAAYAAMMGVAFFSIAFGLKIFMFVVYGIAMWPLLRQRMPAVLAAGTAVFAVTAVGVFLNWALGTMPWEGLDYDTAFGASATTRTWWIPGGIARLPGFARTSFNAAMILGISGLLTMVRWRQPLARFVIFAVAMVAIVLTTSKGMILAFPVAALWLAVQDRYPRMDGQWFVGALCTLSMALPLLVVTFYDMGSALKASDFPLLVLSVWERFTSMWPQAIDLLPDGPLALLGSGIGSIGTPQSYGNAPHHFNAGDSLAMFVFVNFGVAGLLYAAWPAFWVRKVAATQPAVVHRMVVSLLVIAYVYGLSINMIEESFFSIFFGLCFGAATSAWLDSRERKA